MLAVVERHKLRNELWEFLQAGCQSEIHGVERELARHRLPTFESSPADIAGPVQAQLFIGRMLSAAEELYKKQAVSFCSGDACVIDNYRKCTMQQAVQELEKRTKPAAFEAALKSNCRSPEVAARATLTNDFLSAQRLQWSPDLSDKTRELIDAVIKEIRQGAVISYAEDLVKVQPGRKSCKIPVQMCGQDPCISLDEVPESQQEYECAIHD